MTQKLKPGSLPDGPGSPANMAELLDQIMQDENLPPWRRKTLAASLRAFGRLYGRELADMPVDPTHYKDFIRSFHPEHGGIKKSRWSNIKSDMGYLFRYTGFQIIPGRSRNAMAPEWRTLYERLPDQRAQSRLSRFMRYCSARGIAPGEVNDEVASDYLWALKEESFAKDPQWAHRQTIVTWNEVMSVVTGWPQVSLTVPDNRTWWTTPWDQFPSALRQDVGAWLVDASGADIFAENGRARPLAKSTLERKRYDVQVLASALIKTGHVSLNAINLRTLADPETLKGGLRYVMGRSAAGSTRWAYKIAVTVKTMARDWLKVDGQQLEELGAICRKLQPRSTGLTDKNRKRLRQFDDDRNVRLLLKFPRRQVEKVKRLDRGNRADAVSVQIALAVELLLAAPIRLGNLVSLRVDRHIQRTRTSGGAIHLIIPGEEVKNREPLEFELPRETARLLDTYIRDYRPRLTDPASPWLFPGRDSGHKARQGLAKQVRDALFAETGLEVNVHLFRHIAAKLYLDARPGGYEVVRRVLGHRSIETTTNFYSGAETIAATRHFDETILALRARVSTTFDGNPP